MKKLVILILSISLINGLHAQKKDGFGKKMRIKKLLNSARTQYYNQDYAGALKTYREAISQDKDNPKALFGIGICQYKFHRYKVALKYLNRAYTTDPKVDSDAFYHLGITHHRLNNLDSAEYYYNQFKSNSSRDEIRTYDIEHLLSSVYYARGMEQKKMDVKIENLGSAINSFNADYSASVSQDGNTLVFTSRRQNTDGGSIDDEGDYLFFEDIYISTYDKENEEWTEASNDLKRLNSEGHDACLNIAPDGKSMFVYKNQLKVTKSGDIYVSKLSDEGEWGKPKSIDGDEGIINSKAFESSASITSDGKTLYFVSNRQGSEGFADIYVSYLVDKKWSKPKNLGSNINTEYDEKSVFIHPSGKVLFFASEGHNSMGGYDIFYTVKQEDGTWSEPKNMGFPINTVNEEFTFSITEDGKTAYISAFYKDSKGSADIYKIDMQNHPVYQFIKK